MARLLLEGAVFSHYLNTNKLQRNIQANIFPSSFLISQSVSKTTMLLCWSTMGNMYLFVFTVARTICLTGSATQRGRQGVRREPAVGADYPDWSAESSGILKNSNAVLNWINNVSPIYLFSIVAEFYWHSASWRSSVNMNYNCHNQDLFLKILYV